MVAALGKTGDNVSSESTQDKTLLDKRKTVTSNRNADQSWDVTSSEKLKTATSGPVSCRTLEKISSFSSPHSSSSSSLLFSSGSGRESERETGKGGGTEDGSPIALSSCSSLDMSSSSSKMSLSSSNYVSSLDGEKERDSAGRSLGATPRGVTGNIVGISGVFIKGTEDRFGGATIGGASATVVFDEREMGSGRGGGRDSDRGKERKMDSGKERESGLLNESGRKGETAKDTEDDKLRGKHNESKSGRHSGKDSDRDSGKLSMSRASNGSDSNESSCSSLGYSGNKPHKANDKRWEGIQAIRVRDGALGLSHFKLLKRLGCGDIGSVYLAELRGSHSHFAMKVMDKGSLASRKKLLRAQTEREILQSLDHPFLPTLYTHFESEKFLCLVMEFCSGGDLHTLRQRQPGKHFTEQAARFYAAEVLLALEYLHMMGVVYRDLKPENVLVREDGHIMLSDFDLSLRCVVSPTLVKSSAADGQDGRTGGVPMYCIQPLACAEPPSCIGMTVPVPSCVNPVGAMSCVGPSCFVMRNSLPSLLPSFVRKKKDAMNSAKVRTGRGKSSKPKMEMGHPVSPLPELIAEPTGARSMSFVGTHEYLAPEIIKGDGHGSAVDWWTFGIFLYELLFGKTPFKGSGNRATLFNVVGQPLKFPESATGQVSFAARDLIRGLLVKEPMHRLAFKRGAAEIKSHPFFEGVNWALIRCTPPPEVPRPFELTTAVSNLTAPEDAPVRKPGIHKKAGQDSSDSVVPGQKIDDAQKAGEKELNGGELESSYSSGGSYLDFDFF